MKKKLRSQLLLERLNHNPEEKSKKDNHIIENISSHNLFKKAKTVLFYLPIHGEVDLTGLFDENRKNKKFILPRVTENRNMHLHYITDLAETETGTFKIREPLGHLKEANPKDIDLILVPGIAFAKDGHRIGYGKGFYDHLLKKTAAAKIGIAYEFQIVKNIPAESHDTPMDYIASEKRIRKIPIK